MITITHKLVELLQVQINAWKQTLFLFMFLRFMLCIIFNGSLFVQNGIEGFDRNQLAPTDTVEKNCLPTMEVIQLEKSQ